MTHEIDFLLKEKLYKLNDDIDYIYDTSFKQFIEDFKNKNLKDLKSYCINNDISNSVLSKYKIEGYIFSMLSTNDLKTPDSVHANSLLSVPIFCGSFKTGSFHQFNKKKNPYIQLSLPKSVVDIIYEHGYNFSDTLLSKSTKRQFDNSLREGSVKSIISHELVHWIDNAEYDVFGKIIGSAKTKAEREDALLLKQLHVDMTYFEIQAQIHSIEQMKRLDSVLYEEWSLETLLEQIPSLANIVYSLYKKYDMSIVNIWLKFLIKRMDRENLLGKNMKLPLNMKALMESRNDRSYRVYSK